MGGGQQATLGRWPGRTRELQGDGQHCPLPMLVLRAACLHFFRKAGVIMTQGWSPGKGPLCHSLMAEHLQRGATSLGANQGKGAEPSGQQTTDAPVGTGAACGHLRPRANS